VRLTLLLWPLHIFLNEGREKEKPYLPVGGLWRSLAQKSAGLVLSFGLLNTRLSVACSICAWATIIALNLSKRP
jgi:hypothetical protein